MKNKTIFQNDEGQESLTLILGYIVLFVAACGLIAAITKSVIDIFYS